MRSPITWQSVQAEALRRLRAGLWPPGARIPDEAELARELGCARSTVNRALRELAAAGLLERRRKGGTRVPLTPVRKATFEIPIIRLDIEARGQCPGYRLIRQATEPLPKTEARAMRADPGAPFLHLLALHLADDRPFCAEDRWINPETPGLGGADFETLSANEWLVGNTLFSDGAIGFAAMAATPELAGLLHCACGAPLLTITRSTRAGALPITAVRLFYAPGHRLETAL